MSASRLAVCPHCGQVNARKEYEPGTALIRLVESRDEEEFFIFTLVQAAPEVLDFGGKS